MKTRIQRWRSLTQMGFFVLFVLAPPLDIFRYDLTQGHFIISGFDWRLQLDALQTDNSGAALHVLFYGLLPILSIAVTFLYIAWRWGRLYCGWLCPHFSVVETINKLMIRASGKPSIWEKKILPQQQSDFSVLKPDSRFWLPTIIAVVFFAFLWAVSLLTYLLPPFEIYHNLLHAELSRNQGLFISIATIAFCIEFLLARHLFCRFGCAVGLFQSLAWMANKKAMVISFDTTRGRACQTCNNACDNACPMRLQPRTIKRKMFTCTECGECISACTQVQQFRDATGLLSWVQGEAAAAISEPPASRPLPNRVSPGRASPGKTAGRQTATRSPSAERQ
jgi:ferredoxin-type protein NapH